MHGFDKQTLACLQLEPSKLWNTNDTTTNTVADELPMMPEEEKKEIESLYKNIKKLINLKGCLVAHKIYIKNS